MTYIGQVTKEVWSPDESDDAQMRVTMVTGVHHNKQSGDLEAGELAIH